MTEDQTPPMSRPRVAAGALFFDEEGRVLLVKPTYKAGWDIPGGYVEPGETPIEACKREIKEELGLDRTIDRLLVADWAPSQSEGDKILFVFDGGDLLEEDASRITLPAAELKSCAFQPSESFAELMPERLARRLLAAVIARRDGAIGYLEHGVTN
jgi:8-oxo-dGTP diphosphatase